MIFMISFNQFSNVISMGLLLEWLPNAKLHTMAVVSKQMVIFTDRERIRRINSKPHLSLFYMGIQKIELLGNLLLRNPDQVKALDLLKIQMTQPDFVSIIKASPSLARLSVYSPPIGNEDCTMIQNLKKLVDLHLIECTQITDEGVFTLIKGLPQLEELHLSRCDQITDASLSAIATGLQSLTMLDIAGCRNITAAAVRRLCTEMPHLHSIRISECFKIFRDDYFSLRAEFPRISIFR